MIRILRRLTVGCGVTPQRAFGSDAESKGPCLAQRASLKYYMDMWRWHLESILMQKSLRNAKIFTVPASKDM